MTDKIPFIPFALATVSACGGPPFPALVLDDDAAISLHALRPLAARLGLRLRGDSAIFDLLQDWEMNFSVLVQLVAALDDPDSGRGTRGAMTAFSLLDVHAPISLPRQIFCNGANYRQHVIDLVLREQHSETAAMDTAQRRAHGERLMDERAANGIPYMFTKLPSTVIGPTDKILLPAGVRQADWELELGVVFATIRGPVARANALDGVAGYMVVNDLTARDRIYRPDLRAIGTDWLAGKSSPGFLPTGPYFVPKAFVPDPMKLHLRLAVNGVVKQECPTSDMIFDVAQQIAYLTSICAVLPGDLLCTGSPHGNGAAHGHFLEDGDMIEAGITGLGRQSNNCIRAKGHPHADHRN